MMFIFTYIIFAHTPCRPYYIHTIVTVTPLSNNITSRCPLSSPSSSFTHALVASSTYFAFTLFSPFAYLFFACRLTSFFRYAPCHFRLPAICFTSLFATRLPLAMSFITLIIEMPLLLRHV